MTVTSTTARVSYAGNGSTKTFSVPFYFLDASHLRVTKRSSAGVETTYALTTNYTVTGAGSSSGGSITLTSETAAPASGETVVISRNVPLTQETDYQSNDDFPAETHERALDKIVMSNQQQQQDIERSVKFPVSDSPSLNMVLPTSSVRAGKLVKFDASGNIGVTTENYDADLATVAGIHTDVTTVAGIAPNVTTVAGISTKVTTVANNNANVTTVANNIVDVNTVASISADVTTVANANLDVQTLADEIAKVITVANDLNEAVSEIDTVANHITQVDATGNNITSVNTVAGSISNVTTVAGSITNVNNVGGSIANVNTVSTNIAKVQTVADDLNEPVSEINTVAMSIANVDAVGGSIANVNTVAGNTTNINTVAGISGNVTTVAGNNANVTTVATNISNVNTVATNISNINAAVADLPSLAAKVSKTGDTMTGTLTVPNVIAGGGSGPNVVINDAIEAAKWGISNGGYAIHFQKNDGSGNYTDMAYIEQDGMMYGKVDGRVGLYQCNHLFRLFGSRAGANATGNQSLLGYGVQLEASTVYEIYGFFSLTKTAGATSSLMRFLLGAVSGLTASQIDVHVISRFGGTLTALEPVDQYGMISSLGTALDLFAASTTAAVSVQFTVMGTIGVTAGGVLHPYYALSAAPGGAWTVNGGSYFRATPIGTAGADISVGTWVA